MRADWTRILWASSKAREVWEPRIKAIAEAWFDIEVRSVQEGVRQVALIFGAARAENSGLTLYRVAPDRFAIGPEAETLAAAYAANDNQKIGSLLGYPKCCRDFFDRTWGSGALDTTAQMAQGQIEVSGPVEANILGRWLGVRFVPHLPCSFSCQETVFFARRLFPFWPAEELSYALEILSWPMEWSALNGIAEVKTPILKFSTRTTPGPKQIVRHKGTSYPFEGARGIVFPYQPPRRGLPMLKSACTHTDNGFSTREAMDESHTMILDTLRLSPPYGDVADLGAGNGMLIEKIQRAFPGAVVGGIEIDPKKASQHPKILCEDLRKLVGSRAKFDTLIVSQRRFEEIPELEIWARSHARQVLVYSYDEPKFARIQ